MDPDQLASEKPADLDLHCFKYDILIFTFIMVKFKAFFRLKQYSTYSITFYLRSLSLI